ncbi:uncharacterized protein BT62DRAFT_956111 [Guyanagaster necrorhizus]|uniref:Uncharacterized protein n=1 Tax=Guyanagaster necrorhizus TaxID=856835 RepID=A0A9P8AMY8_9AGAR|nr:uncharacterized protein BT62DRAFT_956111 [Guyanagaster necrorhizus MCA 3950]KAG7441259.1 hypothetical protein BT62DRAFT_956111 [Guyanagaster necrorhizus MCA 3950]
MADETMVEAPATTVDAESAATSVTDVVMNEGEEKIKLDKAVRQIEFYFADSNLPYDKFMWTLHAKDAEHWIPLNVVTSFKRMREYAHLLAKIPDALRASELLEVDEAGKQVRRRTEPKEPVGQFERSIYAKGFGSEDENPKLQSRLEDFFQFYGNTNEVRMRRDEAKKFKHSVFVEFTEMSGVEAFLNADPKPTWEGKDLVIMSKEDYCQMKVKEKGLTGKAAQFRKDLITRRKFDAFKNMRNEKNTNDIAKEVEKKDIYLEYLGAKLLVTPDSKGVGTVKEEEIPFVKGATLKFEGDFDNVSFNAVKQPIRDLFEGQTPFIRYQRGDHHGLVGFSKALTDEDIAKVKDGFKKLEDKDLTWSIIGEEEEKTFQIERAQSAARSVLRCSEEGGPIRGRGRGGARGGGRVRGRGRGGRGGRGGHGRRENDRKDAGGEDAGPEKAGEKRKRAVEPDGGPDVGVRGVGAPPAIQSAKKIKTDDGGAAPAS